MKKAIGSLAIALGLWLSDTATASTTIHGTFTDAQTSCLGVVSNAAPGTVEGTWNLNVRDNGQAEISIVIFRDGKLQANWASVVWSPALDNDPGTSYHYLAVVGPTLTLDVTYSPGSGVFVFQAFYLMPVTCLRFPGKLNVRSQHHSSSGPVSVKRNREIRPTSIGWSRTFVRSWG